MGDLIIHEINGDAGHEEWPSQPLHEAANLARYMEGASIPPALGICVPQGEDFAITNTDVASSGLPPALPQPLGFLQEASPFPSQPLSPLGDIGRVLAGSLGVASNTLAPLNFRSTPSSSQLQLELPHDVPSNSSQRHSRRMSIPEIMRESESAMISLT